MFQLTIENPSMVGSIANTSAVVERELKAWHENMAKWIQADLRKRVPTKTGTLQSSIRYEIDGNEATFHAEAQNRGFFYGVGLDEGTNPHVITAKKAKTLAFTTKSGDRVFKFSVNHPGTKPMNFTIDSIEASEREADSHHDVITQRIWAVIE